MLVNADRETFFFLQSGPGQTSVIGEPPVNRSRDRATRVCPGGLIRAMQTSPPTHLPLKH